MDNRTNLAWQFADFADRAPPEPSPWRKAGAAFGGLLAWAAKGFCFAVGAALALQLMGVI